MPISKSIGLKLGRAFEKAAEKPLPMETSLPERSAPMDLLIGIVGAVVIRLAVYVKGKNAKKYRKGMDFLKLMVFSTLILYPPRCKSFPHSIKAVYRPHI